MFIHIKRLLQSNQKINISFLFALFLLILLTSIGYSASYITYTISGDVEYQSLPGELLYNVLKNEAQAGTYAREFTGDHQDSVSGNGTEKIYHWYASTSAQANTINNKNNVIFGNQCWKIYRTTDTGGTKMIYNGEVVNNQCLTNRTTHFGFGKLSSGQFGKNLNSDYWYGTSYISVSGGYSLAGTTEFVTWNATTWRDLVGKYTCMSTSETATCNPLYFVVGYSSNVGAILLQTTSTGYNKIAETYYSYPSNSLSSVGYMYNASAKSYSLNSYSSESGGITSTNDISRVNINNTYYSSSYVDKGTYCSLPDAFQISSTDEISNMVGMYEAVSTTPSVISYIAGVDETTVYYITFNCNRNIDQTYTYGDSYTDNGNGTYTINSPAVMPRREWYSSYSLLPGKYVCKDAVNDTCSEVWYVTTANVRSFIYVKSSNTYKYASSFTYDESTGQYTLSNNSVSFWNIADSTNLQSVETHHYTCLNLNDTCSKLYYIYSVSNNGFYYVELTDGKDVDDLIEINLSSSDVNQNNSVVKTVVDKWYEKQLMGYGKYLEDAIFCNDRSIYSLGGFNPNGGEVADMLKFNQYYLSSSLSCTNLTDMFSTSNPYAQLDYSIGLITANEVNMLGESGYYILTDSNEHWTMTPYAFSANSPSNITQYTYASIGLRTGSTAAYDDNVFVSPVISLNSDTRYLSGTGTPSNPYIVDAPYSDSNSPEISGGGTKIYGSSSTVLTCSAPESYTGEDTLYYSFGYATADGGSPSNWSVESLDSSYTISSTGYVGQRWYSCQVYAYDGENMTSLGVSPSSINREVTINHAQIFFDSLGGNGSYIRYANSGENVIYTGIRNTTTATIPIPTKDNNEFAGWYTEENGGEKVLNDDGTFTAVAVLGYTDGSYWTMTSDKTLYARWICHGLYCKGAYFTMVPTSTSYSVTRTLTGYTSSQTINPSELTLWRVINVDNYGYAEAVSEYVSSTKLYFSGSSGFSKFAGSLQTIASQYVKSGYTSNTRMMGFDYQTSSTSTPSTYPSTTSTPDIVSGTGVEENGGLGGDTLYIKDYLLVKDVYSDDPTTYGSNGLVAYSASNHNTATAYWISSRKFNYTSNTNYAFMGRFIDTSGNLGAAQLYYYSSRLRSASAQYAIRPIIVLNSGLTVASGEGTKASPYVLN